MLAYKASQLDSINLGGHIRHLMDLFRNLFSAANKMCCTPLVFSGQNILKESLFVLEMQYNKSTICRDYMFRVRFQVHVFEVQVRGFKVKERNAET
jgi:hypothetical protein